MGSEKWESHLCCDAVSIQAGKGKLPLRCSGRVVCFMHHPDVYKIQLFTHLLYKQPETLVSMTEVLFCKCCNQSNWTPKSVNVYTLRALIGGLYLLITLQPHCKVCRGSYYCGKIIISMQLCNSIKYHGFIGNYHIYHQIEILNHRSPICLKCTFVIP